MKIVYIPQPLYAALKKAGLRSQDWGDVSKLLGTLSVDDVAFYFYANRSSHCPIPEPLAKMFANVAADPAVSEDDENVRAVITKLRSLEHNGSNADMYEDNAVLTSDCMEEDLLIVTHTTPTDAGVADEATKSETAFYDRVIQQLLAFNKLDVVMGSPVLLGWMKSVQASA